jgi:hypothetical protein
VLRSVYGFITYYLGRLWSGIVWLFTGSPVRQDSVLREANSRDFNRHFQQVLPQSGQLQLYEGDSFFQMCEEARRLRRPILILAIRDRINHRAHVMVQQQLIESNYLRDLANTSFIVYGLYYNDKNRAEPGEA